MKAKFLHKYKLLFSLLPAPADSCFLGHKVGNNSLCKKLKRLKVPLSKTIKPPKPIKIKGISGFVIKVPNGTNLVVKTNPDTGAIEFNQAGTIILKPGEVNWFIPNVSPAIVDARVTNAPTKKA